MRTLESMLSVKRHCSEFRHEGCSLRCIFASLSLSVIVGKARHASVGQETTKYGQDMCNFDRMSESSWFHALHCGYATVTSTATVSEKRRCRSFPHSHSPEGNEATSMKGTCGLTYHIYDRAYFSTCINLLPASICYRRVRYMGWLKLRASSCSYI